MAVLVRHAVGAHLDEQVGAAYAAGLRKACEARPPDQRHAVLGGHATAIERAADRGVSLRHHQPMHGD